MGGMIGMSTGLLHVRLGLHPLLAGIILSTMAYTVNLRLMGRPNVGLFQQQMLFNPGALLQHIGYLIVIILLIAIILRLFLQTEIGLRLRAVGLNPLFAKRQGIALQHYTLLGFTLASTLTALGGALTIQLQRYSDIGMGVGIVIHALAALMLGERLLGTASLTSQLMAPLLGALLYQQIQGFVLWLGLAPTDLKFVTGAILIFLTVIKKR